MLAMDCRQPGYPEVEHQQGHGKGEDAIAQRRQPFYALSSNAVVAAVHFFSERHAISPANLPATLLRCVSAERLGHRDLPPGKWERPNAWHRAKLPRQHETCPSGPIPGRRRAPDLARRPVRGRTQARAQLLAHTPGNDRAGTTRAG